MEETKEQRYARIKAANEAHFASNPKLDPQPIMTALKELGFDSVEVSNYVEKGISFEDGKGFNGYVTLDWDEAKGRFVGDFTAELLDWPGREEMDEDDDDDIHPVVDDTIGLDHTAFSTPSEVVDYILDWRQDMIDDPEAYNIN